MSGNIIRGHRIFTDENSQSPTGPSGVNIPYTYAQLTTVLGNSDGVAGQRYLITDRGDEGIIVTGATATTVSTEAIGNFLNADYQAVGDYSGVAGFVAQLGIWNAGLVVVIGDVVIWNNLHYVATHAGNTILDPTHIDAFGTWSIIYPSRVKGYISESDRIIYDFTIDQIVYREDIYGNQVSSVSSGGTLNFPWGNMNVSDWIINNNTVTSDISNMMGSVIGHRIINTLNGGGAGAIIAPNTFTGILSGGKVESTGLAAILNLTNCAGQVLDSNFSNGCQITAALNGGTALQSINVSLPVTIVFDPATSLSDKTCEDGFSDFEKIIDITGLSTIACDDHTGIYTLTSTNPTESLTTLTTVPVNFRSEFNPASGLTTTFVHGVGANNPRCAGGISAVLNGTKGDWIQFMNKGSEPFQSDGDTY